MPDPILIILFIVFFVLPLLEKAMKKGQPPPPPPGQRPERPSRIEQSVPPEQRTLPPGPERGSAPVAAEDEAAADMIPDDLWEILTGERRVEPRHSPPSQRAEPLPPMEDDSAHWRKGDWRHDAPGASYEREPEVAASPVTQESVYESDIAGEEIEDEIAAADRLQRERERFVHTAERAPRREAELVVYEPLSPSPRRRGSIVADAPLVPARGGRLGVRESGERAVVPPGQTVAVAARPLGVLGTADRSELRRAFVLKEILDRPKGLD